MYARFWMVATFGIGMVANLSFPSQSCFWYLSIRWDGREKRASMLHERVDGSPSEDLCELFG